MFCYSFCHASIAAARENPVKTTCSETLLLAECIPHQITKHKDLKTLQQKALTYPHGCIAVSLWQLSPTQSPWHFLVHLSHARVHHCGTANARNRKKTSDICDITGWGTAREHHHAKRISQRKDRIVRVAKGPLSSWGSMLLSESTLPPRASRSLSNY